MKGSGEVYGIERGKSYPIVIVTRQASRPYLLLYKSIPVFKDITTCLESRSLAKVSRGCRWRMWRYMRRISFS